MSKASAGIGGSIGGLMGLLIGMIIPSEGDIALSFFSRVTGNMITQDPVGFLTSGVYMIIAMVFCSLIGGIIGGLFD
jgi:hypothetical protein